MKLLLTSNGIINPSLEKSFLKLTENKKNLKVAIIPTASNPIEWVEENKGDQIKDYVAKLSTERMGKYLEWLNSYRSEWEKKWYSVIIVDLKENPMVIKKKLESVDIIDVTGGDVNWLLDWAKKSQLDTYLKDILKKWVIYIGTSAGSCLLLADIGLTWWEPDWKLDHIGLGIVDFVVIPHQKENDKQSNVENLTKRRDYLHSITHFPWKIYLLQDGQAIQVIDEKIEHIGNGKKIYIKIISLLLYW